MTLWPSEVERQQDAQRTVIAAHANISSISISKARDHHHICMLNDGADQPRDFQDFISFA